MPDGWRDAGRVGEYLSREIPYRDVAEAIMLEALPSCVERFLDLGTGDGRLIALVRNRHPRAKALGVDFSQPMLARARARFVGDPLVELVEGDLAEPLDRGSLGALPADADRRLDAVVSALAIHHLEDARKRALFGEIFALLRPGGVFLNLDLVTASSREQHERFRLAIGRPQDDPADRLAPLCEQLRWAEKSGFDEVDCRFKWLQLALFVATKRANR
jgi:tRNA (cmo5U34)-methyltransferase